jgi:hypothetical protein
VKLWLQVLFAQGWLLKKRFPDAFPLRKARATPDRFMFVAVLLVSAVGIVDATRGHWASAVTLLILGVAWTLHHAFWLRLDRLLKWDEFWVSVIWGTPVVMEGTFIALVIVGLLDRDWFLVSFAAVFGLAFLGTFFLRNIERRFLFLRDDPIVAEAAGSDGVASCGLDPNVWLEAYWRLPRQILFPRKERHAH